MARMPRSAVFRTENASAADAGRYRVRICVPRRGGWRAWLPASEAFEQRLAGQQGAAVITAQVESETRRGRDYVCVNVTVTAAAADIACAVAVAWTAFRQAAGDDAAGWDLASATAEARPG
jgi:hypothetical protein